MRPCDPPFDAVEPCEPLQSCALSVHELESQNLASARHTPPVDTSPSGGEEELTRQRKEWHRRRLQDRWRCNVSGHSYCFRDDKGLHIQLVEASLDEWADNIVC
jgi:hypothetical protein